MYAPKIMAISSGIGPLENASLRVGDPPFRT